MITRREFAGAALAWVACSPSTWADGLRDRYGIGTTALQVDAVREGALRIDAAVDLSVMEDLLEAFKAHHPQIALEFRRMSSSALYQTFLREMKAGSTTADILISPAMDLQFKLVNDGFALPYASPHTSNLPAWAVWKSRAYAICTDSLVFLYNKKRMPPADVPHSHLELTELLRRKPEFYKGRITSYDPATSGTGYLYYTQDLLLSHDTLDFVQAVGGTDPHFYASGGDVLPRVTTGEHLLAYNMIHSYMAQSLASRPDLGIVYPDDYTLTVARTAFVPITARHPSAGKLMLDFLLSEIGQLHFAQQQMLPVRQDIQVNWKAPPVDVVRRIHFGPALLAGLDTYRRRRVLDEWRRTLASTRAADVT